MARKPQKRAPYAPPVRYTPAELDEAAYLDQVADAEHAEREAQAQPARREELLAYAARCRQRAAEIKARTAAP